MFQRNWQDFCTLVCVFAPLLSQTEGHRMFGSLLWLLSVCIQTVHVIGDTTSEGADTKHLIGPKMDTWLTVDMMFSWSEYWRSRMNFLCVCVYVRECTSTRRSAPLVACRNMTCVAVLLVSPRQLRLQLRARRAECQHTTPVTLCWPTKYSKRIVKRCCLIWHTPFQVLIPFRDAEFR